MSNIMYMYSHVKSKLSGDSLGWFDCETSKLIDEYNVMRRQSFFQKPNRERLKEVTSKIQSICSRYCSDDSTRILVIEPSQHQSIHSSEERRCECGAEIVDMVCGECAYVHVAIEYEDKKYTDLVNINKKTMYVPLQHFENVCDIYQGIHKILFPDDILALLKVRVAQYSLSSTVEPKKMKEHLKALKVDKKFHDYIPYINHELFAIPYLKIGDIRATLRGDYQAVVSTFQEIKEQYIHGKNGCRFRNNHFILYKLLRKYGRLEDSNRIILIKEPTKIRIYNTIYEHIRSLLNWKKVM